ncbi:MAG: hypothetical protein QOG71_3363 [Pyrinomonadaceae bacterium]|nr:hypothetical protein [Pyrinomonadaceae bacterium]
MSRKNVEDLYPLSPLQQGLLFHTVYAPESGVYVEQLNCTLSGALDLDAFERAWRQTIDRHPILRTAFVWEGVDEPVQVVRRSVRLPFAQEDWRALPAAEQHERLRAYLTDDLRRGFDLSKAPLMRLALLRLSADTYQFIWSYHHLMLDGWCIPLVLREVFAFYEAFSRGESFAPERPRPYRDYIAWLRRQDLTQAEAFWRQTLKGFNAPTTLPGVKTRGDAVEDLERWENEGYGEQELSLTTDTTAALQSFARRHGLTLNTLVQGAWALLLNRYSGEPDVLFGVTVAGRPAELAGVEAMVGLFINTLPLRVEVDGGRELLSWLKSLQEQQTELRQYEYSPLVQVQGWSDVPRGVPLFESLLVFENYPVDASFRQQLAQLSVSNIQKVERTNYPLNLLAVPGTQLLLRFSYDRRRFDALTIARMLGQLQTALESFVVHPARRLAAVPLLAPAERRQLLVEWNDTARDYPPHACLHELFEAQAERTPDAIALVFENERVNYRELNRRANALAERLRASGVRAETRVGVFAERSVEMVVALVGVLKAGGAYVPLEPTYPAERLSFMLADARVSVLLTQERLLAALPSQHDAEIICLDRDWKEIDGLHAENVAGGAPAADNAAYVIYTSGSTGRPKGVVNTHRGICNRLLWMQDEYELTRDDRVLQKTPFSFDVSVWEFFWPLITGAQLVVARPGGHQDSAYLVRLIEREAVTTLHFVPSMLSVFLSEPGLEECRSLRRVICSGEALTKELQERFYARLNADLHNLYGPTEAAVDVSYWACERDDARPAVPIGRPIANTQLYVLDGELQPVPVGVAGELYIAGVGLARGYLNRPALTADKFIANPFSDEPGARLYRTGDAARFLEDGEIEFLGRLDDQVKLRGFRIELGEIESVLAEHPSLKECVVTVREDTRGDGGDRRIVAYFVHAGDTPAMPDALRSFLRELLPEYMIPSAFVALPALPLTPNGKLDRRALPAPEPATVTGDGQGVGLLNPLEEVVAGIWAEVLGLERVGLRDNFFESGGHSLLALRVVSRLRSTLKIEVPVRELFDAPTVAGFAARVASLQRAKLNLPSSPMLGTVARDGDVPPSFAQQRLWFLDQLEPGSAAYNIPAAIRLRGKLDARALAESFNEVLRRHEVLRTSFATVDGQPVQRIAPVLRLELPVEDVRAAAAATEREAVVHSVAAEEAGRAFNLGDAPLLRLRLLRVDEDEHVLLLVMHHIISDGWSIGILIREVAALYEAFSHGRPSPLAELPVQYADYAVWQREWLQGDVLANQLAYWKRQLDGSPPRLQLPAMRDESASAPESRAFRGAKQHFVLPVELSGSLARLSRREGATLFMTLLAAFQTLLQRYTGEDDITTGTPVANRNHEQIEGLVGFFVNTLVLRTDLTDDPTFTELLRRVREVALDAYAHQDVPFEKLVEELQPARDLSHAPLFQVMFVLQNAPVHALELAGLKLDPLPLAGDGAKFDLTLSMEETGEGLKGLFEYNRDLFDEAAMGRLISHFRNLLEAVAADPARRLSELQLLDEDERRQLLVEWNDTGVEYERDSCLHELFERQVERAPDALAVSFVGEDGRVSVLTYAELNARANKVARHLARLGVGAEDVVGIVAARAPETLVGVLGVLKAGGAYLPLDPAYPSARLAYMLVDARARVLLTQQQHAESLPAHDAEVVYLDAGADLWARESAENLARRATPENLAYIIYTSGSTGQPKGVMVNHRGLSNLSRAEALAFELKAESRVLQFASWSFDASVFETVMTLMAGATICFAPAEAEHLGDAFTRFLREQSVNTIALTPTTLAAVPHAELPDLQTIITGGEPCPPELVARWTDDGRRRFFNVYGPTETTTWATFARCIGDGRTPSIGLPIANTQIYILDERLQPVPIGVVGQVHIGGVALARGYLNRPALTAERFIPDPFGIEFGARLYRTGDLARYRAGGDIEFAGRIDQQVKLRGFRIELGEIEAALAAHSRVRECAVVVREDARGERRIVAYATLDTGASAPPASEWRAFLKAKLPEHMLPSAFVVLEAMPLTPGGKLDRRALQPAPEQATTGAGESLSPARTPTEEVLAGIWAEVLGLERVGPHDNFFESGGHSLLATQLVSRVREVFKVELPLRDFFNAPTVGEVAAHVESLRRAERGLELTPITHAPRDRELPLSFAQQRLWFLDQFEPGNSFYNVPSAVRLTGALDVDALEHSLNEVVRRHEVLRTTFESTQGQPRQVIAPVLKLSLAQENLQQLNKNERRAEVQRLAVEEAQRSFDLSRAPLVRARLLRVAELEHVLLFTMHHIISDGWSVNVLLGEVAALYEAYRRGEPSSLAELPIQYADYAAWQREWLDGAQLDAQLRYWREQLRDAPALLELPTDRPRQPVQTYRGATARFTLSQSLSQGLQRLSRREGATLFMTLLAAFQTLLQRYSGAGDVVVGTPIAGRNRAEIEELIGFFVNTLVLRTTFDGDPSFVELLARVREECLGAYAHQDVPFEKLVEELQPEREMSHTPLFQVMFSLQNAVAGAQLPGLELSSLEVESGVAKFDLTLGMNETGDGTLAGLFEYNTDLFDAETVERMIGHLTTLLEGIAADPQRLVSELPLLTEGERRQVVVEWNETGREYVRGECVHEMFERQAEARPEAVAIACEGKEWTFAEVNARANKLARYLRRQDVGAETLVGVLMERSAEMFICLLGVLKAGAAYLPLDPAYPQERLAFILQDARVTLLLTEDSLRQTTFAHEARVVCVDAEREAVARESGENPAGAASADNLVYVIYTSGSTGRPKGVCVPHGALANHARAVGEHYGLQPADRVLQFASLSFDVAAEELFASWARGAAVVLMPPDDYLLQTFLGIIEEQRISVVNLSASYWYEWVAALSRGEAVLPQSLRLVVTGSEKVSTAQLATWQALADERVRWINAYGPTEATITTTIFEPQGELKYQGVGSVPIGRPVNNARVYLLDKKMQPVPVGVAGELYIGGAGVARGYLNRAELTAEKFIPDLFGTEAGARLYRTGDWARYLPDGQVEFLRRMDQQVKVRGFRIELGEIESAIAAHAGVHETAVVVREDTPEEKRIVAYVVPKRAGGGEASAAGVEVWPSLGEYQVYDELMYFAMTNDEQRTGKYEEAIKRLVKDKTVVEIGTGGEAILARLCVAAGAKKVYAIEALDDAREAAGALVESLGLSDKITLLGGYSFDVALPEKVDVCVSELIGTIGGSEGTIAILNDAAARFLKDDGLMIPRRCVTKIAAVQLPAAVRESPRFTELSAGYAERIFARVGHKFDVRVCLRNFPREHLLSDAGVFEELDFGGHVAPGYTREIVLKVTKKGRLDGFLLWLNLHTVEDVVIDNLAVESSWLPVYFPVFDPGVEVCEGDIIRAVCSASLSDNGVNPDYEIAGTLFRQDGEAVSFAHRSSHHASGYGRTQFYRRLFSNQPAAPTGDATHGLSAEKLRAYLAERVPNYMLPSAFVLLEEMPLTPSGKLDARALPAPEASRPETNASFALPRSPVEEVLAGIFGEVLKLERVGVNDNFFALGGHSLLATQVVARAREVFRVELPLRALFEAPTVAGLAAQVETLDASTQTATAPPPLRRVPREGELPLSFIQQRFWFLHQLMPESPAYNIPTAVRLKGALDVPALERSFNEVVRRHEILRTRFVSNGGRPEQLIADELKLELPLIDLSERAPQEREAEARRLAAEEAQRPFDLSRGTLLRCALLRLDADEFILLFTMHHIVSDGWSAGVLIRDLTAIYEAYAASLPSPLAELPIQFADFAHWQREWLQGEVLEHRLAYWRKQFGDALPVLNLPTDRPRPPVPTDHGAIQTLALPARLRAAIESLGQRESVTSFMLLLAAFKVLLHRYTGQDDILVGSSIANRNHVETEGLIGLLINTLILRTDLSGDPTFDELLARVREASLGAYAHQDLPFEQLLEELRADFDAAKGTAPVFQVAFQLQNFSMPTLELKNLTLSPFDVEGRTAKFDLSLSVIETPDEWVASLEYNTDLFEAATIKRMLEHYRTVLEGVVAAPTRRISALPLLNDRERRQLLSEWNPAFESDAPAACLHHLFEAQARRRPDGIALVFEDRQLTYGELNWRANKLAHYLRRKGVGADTLVAICVERSVEMLVGILGILKAGGAYVPLDPAYPKERLAFILEDTRARLLLTQQSLVEMLPAHDASIVLLDADWPEIADTSSDENLGEVADAGALAYVIYTSGSTGRPKGVLVSHENVTRLLEATQAHFAFDESDVWTLFHSYAFDFSVWEIWGALAHGGKLIVVPYWVSRSAEAFRRLLASEEVTVLNQTPSAFRQLAAADEAADSSDELKLRLVIFGGEALELQSLRPWFARHGDRRPQLVNMFGITETTVHVTYRALTSADLELASGSVIGRPLECLQVYLLDGRGQPVPIGVPAEICVGGAGVARGYLNRAGLTAERFVPHPFSDEPGARLYRSGDLARYLADGDIEYLGRIDNQVKVRGFRIELGEIESALAEHASVRECTVVADRDANGETKLLAYLVGGQTHAAPSTTELREFLQTKLPEHMMPAAFIVLDAMPLTPNGKIDRRALPAPGQARPQLGREFVAPRTPVEQELANIWRELLGVAEVGIHDDFFELGGHSLLLTQLASWIRKDFQVEVPLRVLFDTPTITDMTKAILARQVEQESQTDLAEMLSQLKQLSPHEVKAMLEKMGGSS